MLHRITWAVPACLLLLPPDALARDVVDLAASLIGRPYVWGAEGPEAFDCSGLTQYVYQQFGIELPRRAVSQSRIGDPASRRLWRGDLLFFSTDTRKSLVTHVGLYEGGDMMIDASQSHGRVRRDNLNDRYWVERFMFARRIETAKVVRERPGPPNDRGVDQRRPPTDGRDAAVRVLRRVAEALFDLSRR